MRLHQCSNESGHDFSLFAVEADEAEWEDEILAHATRSGAYVETQVADLAGYGSAPVEDWELD